MLEPEAVDAFERDGFVAIRGAVPGDVIAACQSDVDAELRSRDIEPEDPASWASPVVRLDCPQSAAFTAAGALPGLWSTYDQLLGAETWWRWPGLGGTIPVRFPHPDDPGDAGWHVDASYEHGGNWCVNVASRGRGLLALFLLSDVDQASAPTELKIGSHLDIPKLLVDAGAVGMSFIEVSRRFSRQTLSRPSAFATGRAGDVFVCHPFLVHRATWPHLGTRPRAIAQPPVVIRQPFTLTGDSPSPVERAILAGLT